MVLVQEDSDEPIRVQAVPGNWTDDDVERYLSGAEYDLATVAVVTEIDVSPGSRSDVKTEDGGVP